MGKKIRHSLEFVRDISEKVYRIRLEDKSGGGDGAISRMIAKDGDHGEKLRSRAESYDALTRAYLEALNITPAATENHPHKDK